MIVANEIRDARTRIRDGVVFTPALPAFGLGRLLPCKSFLKLESAQRTGSFKDRGALNRLLMLTPEERKRGLVTASAGNHAQAVAYHGARLGLDVTVVMPVPTPLVKRSNTEGFGATIRMAGDTLAESIVEARRLEAEEGRFFVHAYDDQHVIAGQGTIGLELLEQVPDATTVIVPIGGGGLISGISIAMKQQRPDIRIVGVEAAAAASARASRDAGKPVHLESVETIADGIAVKQVGALTFPIIERYVDDIVVVEDAQIVAAVHLLLERQKLLAEGAAATTIAAMVSNEVGLASGDVAVAIISGGNIDVTLLERIIDQGLVADGRLARLSVTVKDRPGQLRRLTQLVAEQGANVVEVAHRRAFADISVRDVDIALHLETRGHDHMEKVVGRLREEGYVVRNED